MRREDWERVAQIALNVIMEQPQALATVSGSVRNTQGSPMDGKSVQLLSSRTRRSYQAMTDGHGRSTMQGVAVGHGYQLRVYPGDGYWDYRRQHVGVTDAGLKLHAVAESEGTRNLSGQVVDVEGNPIGGFSLMLRNAHSPRGSVWVTGNAGGNFVVRDVPAGTVVLESWAMPRLVISTGARAEYVRWRTVGVRANRTRSAGQWLYAGSLWSVRPGRRAQLCRQRY